MTRDPDRSPAPSRAAPGAGPAALAGPVCVAGILALGACAQLPDVPVLGGPSAERVDELVEAHRYDDALALLARVDEDAPEGEGLAARKDALARAREAWVDEVIARAVAAGDRDAWAEAVGGLDTALEALPQDARLAAARHDLLTAREAYIEAREHRIRVAEARYLIARLPELEGIVAAWPDHRRNAEALRDARARARKLSHALLEAGEAAWAARAPDAPELLALAHRLHPRDRSAELLAEIEDLQRDRERARLAAVRDRYEARVERWRQAFEEALGRDEPVRAREAIDALAAMEPEPEGLDALRERLEARNLAALADGIEQGRQHYLRGEIQEALRAWEAVEPLAPDDVLLSGYIARARRFLENLERHEPEARTTVPDEAP